MTPLTGKTILITGGSRGIGLACARRFLDAGATVALCARNPERLEAASQELGGAHGYPADVSDSAQVNALFKTVRDAHGPLYGLINNAGIAKEGLAPRLKDAAWRESLATNLDGAFYCCREAARDMLRQREGRIVNISSVLGLRGGEGQAAYAAAKAGLIGLTKSLAREWASRRITVNAVAPGYVETEMTAGLKETQRATLLERIPLGRPGTPEEIAHAVHFLVSPEAAYITGSVLTVDGGFSM